MTSIFKSHPFAVRAYFEHSLVLGYALPLELLRPLVPSCLQLDTFQDHWAFCAVAMVKTKALRPAAFPTWLGRNFSLIGYRVFVRYRTSVGKELRGLFILRSETDRYFMKVSGNIFTRYQYETTDVEWDVQVDQIGVRSNASKLDVLAQIADEESPLPTTSPFKDWKEARRFAGPMPYTFSIDEERNRVVIIRGVRTNWQPQPLQILRDEVGFLKDRNLTEAKLANAFLVQDVPYLWEAGQFDSLETIDADQ